MDEKARPEKTVAVVAWRIGVLEANLWRWRDKFLAAGKAARSGGKAKKGSDLLYR